MQIKNSDETITLSRRELLPEIALWGATRSVIMPLLGSAQPDVVLTFDRRPPLYGPSHKLS